MIMSYLADSTLLFHGDVWGGERERERERARARENESERDA